MKFNPLIIAGFLAGLAPVPKLSCSEWAADNINLSIANSVRPGKYDVNYTPYCEDIGDDLSRHSPVEEIIWKKSNQVGATRVLNNWIGATMDNDPAPMLMVMPTEDLAKRNSVLNIGSMINETPSLLKKVGRARDRDSGNTTLRKMFPLGFLIMCGANSPNDARSTSFKKVALDELSAYPVDMGGEGDPYKLFYGRTKTFSSTRKVFALSTPTTDGVCRISSLYETTDKRKYHIKCPRCEHLQHLEFGQLRWKEGVYDADNVYYECVEKQCRINERSKPKMMLKVNGACWIPTAPQFISIRKKGYHINALYAPLGQFTWGDMAREYDEAMNSENKDEAMKTFTNLHLGETWSHGGNITDYEDLMDRAIDYKDALPVNDVVHLTAGVDIQKNRIEIEVLGWAKNKQTYSVDYKVLEGSTDERDVWDQLKEYLLSDFLRADGSRMNISYSCIDTGYLACDVYEFCEAFGTSKCGPVKGSATQLTVIGPAKTVNYTKANKKKGTTLLKSVGVSLLKHRIYSRLKLRIPKDGDLGGVVPDGYCWFPKDRSTYYFKGLCSEVYRVHEGKEQWVKISTSTRNEPLDLRVYAMAAGEVTNIVRRDNDWFDRQIALFEPERKEFTKPPARERRKSDFWNNNK